MHEHIINILEYIKPGIDYEKETNLIEDKILESFEIIRLVSELSEVFETVIPLTYLRPENFKSVDTIVSMMLVILDEE